MVRKTEPIDPVGKVLSQKGGSMNPPFPVSPLTFAKYFFPQLLLLDDLYHPEAVLHHNLYHVMTGRQAFHINLQVVCPLVNGGDRIGPATEIIQPDLLVVLDPFHGNMNFIGHRIGIDLQQIGIQLRI